MTVQYALGRVAVAAALLLLLASPAAADHAISCDSFRSQAAAQAFFTKYGGDADTNVGHLDEDGDGVACEDHPGYALPGRDATPSQGGAGGPAKQPGAGSNPPDNGPSDETEPREGAGAGAERPEGEGSRAPARSTGGANTRNHGGETPNWEGGAEEGSYTARLAALNGSGVSGEARLDLKGDRLRVSVKAEGLEPRKRHQQHAHGPRTGAARCPAGGGGAVGADKLYAAVGGHVLEFTPYPTADGEGNVQFERVYTVDRDRTGDLQNLAVILHGMTVEGEYDDTVAVACGVVERAEETPRALPDSGGGGLAGGGLPAAPLAAGISALLVGVWALRAHG